MNGRTDWSELFFSAAGRINRAPFLAAAALLLIAGGVYESVVSRTLHWLTGWFAYPALIFLGACVLSKRLHDRGRSGWWAAVILFALVAVWSGPTDFFDFLFTAILVWAVVELGVMQGEPGANRFGPSPLPQPVRAVTPPV
jgi:uncharacterized membrane protein YhaH (DUF805 family)